MYRGHELCDPCFQEYRMIIDGRDSYFMVRTMDKIPEWVAFERGWLDAEEQEGLDHLEIPSYIQDLYRKVYNEDLENDE